ncbi:unnamed protein product [Peniophora sp. CBMAI 1063]|nr:unnamed protein product [Peniophora sp. CBMAI 1063]
MSTVESLSNAIHALSTEDVTERSAALKTDANKLFGEKKYDDAIRLYSQAIAIDKDNALLYCNRSASYFALHAFGKACQDAAKASELDPSYTKAYYRLAASQHALQLYGKSARSWKRAIDSISSDDANGANAKLRADYTKHYKKAQRLHARLEQASKPITGHPDKLQIVVEGRKFPWDRAQEMIPYLLQRGITTSSAYALVSARQTVSRVIALLALARAQGPNKGIGATGVVSLLSNAILAEPRSLFLSYKDILPNLEFQMKMELNIGRTPKELVEVKAFGNGIRALHAEGGHDLSRKAFALGVRAGIIDAFMMGKAGRVFDKAVERYDKVLTILEWGKNEWHGVPDEERGVVFNDTFIRGVKMLRLQAYHQALGQSTTDTGIINLDGLGKDLNELTNEIARDGLPAEEDPGFRYSFFYNILAEVFALRGYFTYNHVALLSPKRPEVVDACKKNLRLAAECYSNAAKTLPEDDENHCWYLKVGLDQLFSAGEPLRITLPIMETIRTRIPISEEIWRFSERGLDPDSRERAYDDLATFESQVKAMLATGACTLDQHVAPTWADPKRYFGDIPV